MNGWEKGYSPEPHYSFEFIGDAFPCVERIESCVLLGAILAASIADDYLFTEIS